MFDYLLRFFAQNDFLNMLLNFFDFYSKHPVYCIIRKDKIKNQTKIFHSQFL